MSVSFNSNYNFIFRTPKKVLWKLANALVAANECSQSLGSNYFVQTPDVFVVAVLIRILSPSQSKAHCCDKSVRPKVRNNVHIHAPLHKLTSHNHKIPTFSAFWFEIIEILYVVVSNFRDLTVSECKQLCNESIDSFHVTPLLVSGSFACAVFLKNLTEKWNLSGNFDKFHNSYRNFV